MGIVRVPGHIAVEVRKAFYVFDVDHSGTISADEMLTILTRATPHNKQLTLEDAKEIIADFDTDGDGNLNLNEFANAWAKLGHANVKALDMNASAAEILKGHEAAVKALFDKIDGNGDGCLEVHELKDIVEFKTGEKFNDEEFILFYDVQGAKSGDTQSSGDIDLKEFGWFLASWAASNSEMPQIISEASAAADFVMSQAHLKQSSSGLQGSAAEYNEMYGKTLVGHRSTVFKVFEALDENGDKQLSLEELRDVVRLLNEGDFDEGEFLQWWDVQGTSKTLGDSEIDKYEFSWFVADWAGSNENMAATCESFMEAIALINERKASR